MEDAEAKPTLLFHAYTLPEYFYDKSADEQRKCFDAVFIDSIIQAPPWSWHNVG